MGAPDDDGHDGRDGPGGGGGAVAGALAVALLAAAAAALLALRCALIGRLNANWDEVYFLSKVHSYLRGELTGKLLTFHVHFFGWVPAVSDNEIVQVMWLRGCMLALQVAAAGAVFAIGRRLLSSPAAGVFAVLAGQSFTFVLMHGNSARFDPIITALFLVGAALIVTDDAAVALSRRTLAAGVLAGIALLVSIKAVFFVPTLAVLAFARVALPDAGARARTKSGAVAVVGLGAAMAITVLVLFTVHALSLAHTDPYALPGAGAPMGGKLRDTMARMLGGRLFPSAKYIVASLRCDGYTWALLAAGVVVGAVRVARGRGAERRRAVQALAFALPIASLVLYRNAFPYFYTCLIVPAGVVAAAPFAVVERAIARRRGRLAGAAGAAVVVVAIVATLPLAWQSARFWRDYGADELTKQKDAVAGVHRIFPTPVPYVDRCSMIGSFPKLGPFMSTWALDDYRKRGEPVMRALLLAHRPQFLLADVETLQLDTPWSQRQARRLLPDDFAALSESFVPYWGRVWIAGRDVALTPEGAGAFDLLIAGPYVTDPPLDVVIDGAPLAAGAARDLAAGHHELRVPSPASPPPSSSVRLRTARALPPPDDLSPPTAKLFEKLGLKKHKAPAPAAVDEDDEEE